jgi:hypothetical protein
MAAREIGQLSLIEALALVACYARTGSPEFDKAAVRWLARLAEERDSTLRGIRLAANALEAMKTKQHDLAEKMMLRSLGSVSERGGPAGWSCFGRPPGR